MKILFCNNLVSRVLSVVTDGRMDLDNLGDLLSFKNIAQYKESDRPLWLLLSLVLFRENVRNSPKYIGFDGKTGGPTKRKFEHLHELDKAEDDDDPVRKLVCTLLTDTISAEDFAHSDIIESAIGS